MSADHDDARESASVEPRPAVLVVLTDVDPENEDELNRWYAEEHIPQRLGFPGFVRARRFTLAEGLDWPGARWQETAPGRKYLTIYELEDVSAMNSQEYIAAYDDLTPWSKRVNPSMRNC